MVRQSRHGMVRCVSLGQAEVRQSRQVMFRCGLASCVVAGLGSLGESGHDRSGVLWFGESRSGQAVEAWQREARHGGVR